ncbi:hypothetical protein QVD17_30826 [Tagetes erecta]|uniref:Uncharacterized protein n=1 Tax=Tagetes erecta TaxID=13708 RepID=A0AAD8K509_TARER|nr:hypothetical protein QVD17_30826 [Tagetes erecta]
MRHLCSPENCRSLPVLAEKKTSNGERGWQGLQMFSPPLLLQMSADVVRRLQTFSCRKNKQHLKNEGIITSSVSPLQKTIVDHSDGHK